MKTLRNITKLLTIISPWFILLYIVCTFRIYSYSDANYLGFAQEITPIYWLGLLTSYGSFLSLSFVFKNNVNSFHGKEKFLKYLSITCILLYLYVLPPLVSRTFCIIADSHLHMINVLAVMKEGMFNKHPSDMELQYICNLYHNRYPGAFIWTTIFLFVTNISPLDFVEYFPIMYTVIMFILQLILVTIFLKPPYRELALIFWIVSDGLSSRWFSPSALGVILYTLYMLILYNGKKNRGHDILACIIILSIAITHLVSFFNLLLILIIYSLLKMQILIPLGKHFKINYKKEVLCFALIIFFLWHLYISEVAFTHTLIRPMRELIMPRHLNEIFQEALTPITRTLNSPVRSLCSFLKLLYTTISLGPPILIFLILLIRGKVNKEFLVFTIPFFTAILAIEVIIGALIFKGVLYERIFRYAALPFTLIAIQYYCKWGKLRNFFIINLLITLLIVIPAAYCQECVYHTPLTDMAGCNFLGKYGAIPVRPRKLVYNEVQVRFFRAYYSYLQNIDFTPLEMYIFSNKVKKINLYFTGNTDPDNIIIKALYSRVHLLYNNNDFLCIIKHMNY